MPLLVLKRWGFQSHPFLKPRPCTVPSASLLVTGEWGSGSHPPNILTLVLKFRFYSGLASLTLQIVSILFSLIRLLIFLQLGFFILGNVVPFGSLSWSDHDLMLQGRRSCFRWRAMWIKLFCNESSSSPLLCTRMQTPGLPCLRPLLTLFRLPGISSHLVSIY